MNKRKHYSHQKKYFNKEFSQVTEYSPDTWQKTYIRRIKENVLDKDYKKKKLLDIGTGTGYVAMEIARMGVQVIACDLSKQAIDNLKVYKRKFGLPNMSLILCNAGKIPLKNESIDYIIANALLEHIPEEAEAIKEWKRILKPGGKIFIAVPLKFQYIWPFLWLPNFIHDKKIGHLRRYNLSSLQKKFNMNVVNYYYSGHLIKIIGVILSFFLKNKKIQEYIEFIDGRESKLSYGANNIIVIFQNI